jgi:hypothetical protein
MATTTLLLLSPLIITGCNDQKEQEFGKIMEQVNVLRMENSQLKKIIARRETNESGTTYTSLGLISVFIISGGLVVWVINRRKNDGPKAYAYQIYAVTIEEVQNDKQSFETIMIAGFLAIVIIFIQIIIAITRLPPGYLIKPEKYAVTKKSITEQPPSTNHERSQT